MYSKMQGRAAIGGNGLCDCAPSSSNTTTSPFSTSRTYCAPIISRAQVSEARIGQRSSAKRVARTDQFLVGQADKGIGAFELAQTLDETVDEAVAARARHQMQDHLGVGGRLHHGAFVHQVLAQRDAVGQVAVVTDGEAAAFQFREQRLHVAQHRFARCRIAHVPDRRGAGQAVDHFPPRERVADQAEAAFGMETLAVETDDAGGFLAAMLERVQAERGDGGGVGMAENAEHAAFFAQPVGIRIEFGACGLHEVLRLLLHRYRVPLGLVPVPGAGRSDFWSGPLSGGSWSSGFCRFNRFKMVLSGSSGNMDINHCPVLCNTTFDLALLTHSGWLRSGTSQAKNRKATTTMISPRPSPNRKPSVRSSAPTRLSSTMSEMRTVMTETTSRVIRNTAPMLTPAAPISLGMYCFAIGSTRE